jgi:hypothetical protein
MYNLTTPEAGKSKTSTREAATSSPSSSMAEYVPAPDSERQINATHHSVRLTARKAAAAFEHLSIASCHG